MNMLKYCMVTVQREGWSYKRERAIAPEDSLKGRRTHGDPGPERKRDSGVESQQGREAQAACRCHLGSLGSGS